VDFIFWIPLAPVTTFKYRLYNCIPRRSPPSPFDKEFAGSPVMPDIPTGMTGPFILEIAEAIPDRKKGVRSAWLDLCRTRSSCASHLFSTEEAPFKAGLISGNAIALPGWRALTRRMIPGIG
jgi:hypothetical protein